MTAGEALYVRMAEAQEELEDFAVDTALEPQDELDLVRSKPDSWPSLYTDRSLSEVQLVFDVFETTELADTEEALDERRDSDAFLSSL